MHQITIKANKTDAKRVLCDPEAVITKNQEYLTITGAKLYYRGGGWWRLSGYNWDGSDIFKLLANLWRKCEKCNETYRINNAGELVCRCYLEEQKNDWYSSNTTGDRLEYL